MPTNAQIEANRRNALKSTGPRTPAGKAQSARNALHHGLASISAHAFLAVEDQAAFERLLHRYVLKYQPAHADEVDLLTDAVFRKWRQQGLWTIEAQAIEIDIAALQHDLPKANAPAHLAHAVHHSLDHSLKELQALQATRVGDEPTLPLLNPEVPVPNEPNSQAS